MSTLPAAAEAGVPATTAGLLPPVHAQAQGRELEPTAWNGAPAGGHHREGALEFTAPKPAPQPVALRVQRSGETQPRSFRFTH